MPYSQFTQYFSPSLSLSLSSCLVWTAIVVMWCGIATSVVSRHSLGGHAHRCTSYGPPVTHHTHHWL